MPNTSQNARYDKTMLYKLCGFLIKKKLGPEGRGLNRPLSIRLQEMSGLLSYSYESNNNGKINQLKYELKFLGGDGLEVKGPRLIKIINPSILNRTSQNFMNSVINISYTRPSIEEYIKNMVEGDEKIKEGENYNKLIFDPAKIEFRYQGKELVIRTREDKSYAINVCLLMYGYGAKYSHPLHGNNPKLNDVLPSGENYKIGNEVDINTLRELAVDKGEENMILEDRQRKNKNRPIRDAIYGINKRAYKKFGIKEIFHYKNNRIKVVNI